MDKLKQIISEYVDVPMDQIDDNMSLKNDIGIDSFGLISMLCEIEESFDIDIPESELSNFQTLHDMYSYIEANN